MSERRYFLVVDAGSSGSRIFVYENDNTKTLPSERLQLINEKYGRSKTEPGLSSFSESGDYAGACTSISYLLDYAVSVIPEEMQKSTPLLIFGTAGLRVVDKNKRNGLFDSLISCISSKYDFFVTSDNVRVISGNEEAAFAWIATNAKQNLLGSKEAATIGSLDLGGGSMQIAFQLKPSDIVDDKHITEVFGKKLFTASFLGYGANAVRKRDIKNRIVPLAKNLLLNNSNGHEVEVIDPCLNPGYLARYKLVDDNKNAIFIDDNFFPPHKLNPNPNPNGSTGDTFVLAGTGDWAKCLLAMEPLLNKNDSCKNKKTCGINNTNIPDIRSYSSPTGLGNTYRTKWFAFSEYYYTLEDIWHIGKSPYNANDVKIYSEEWCAKQWSELYDNFDKNYKNNISQDRLHNQCYKAAWMALTLEGLNFCQSNPTNQSLSFRQIQENGFPIHTTMIPNHPDGISWTLGAVIDKFPSAMINEVVDSQQTFYVTVIFWLLMVGGLFATFMGLLRLNRIGKIKIFGKKLKSYSRLRLYS